MAQDRMIVPYHRAPLVYDKQLYDVDINVAYGSLYTSLPPHSLVAFNLTLVLKQ